MYNSDAMLEEDIGQPLRAKLMSESKSAVTLSSYCPVCSWCCIFKYCLCDLHVINCNRFIVRPVQCVILQRLWNHCWSLCMWPRHKLCVVMRSVNVTFPCSFLQKHRRDTHLSRPWMHCSVGNRTSL